MTGFDLRLEQVTKRFGAAVAVDAVSFAAPSGAFTCLVGPSGCGKTTLLRLIAGLETPDAGRIFCGGEDLTPLAPGERRLGMVPQSYALFPTLDVFGNIAFGLPDELPREAKARRVTELLASIGLAGLERRRPSQLSGGQQQRVALARALAAGPRLLLLDEPLSALDPQVRDQLRDELKRVQSEVGVTTVMVTHDQSEAMALADNVALMKAGRLVQFGPPEALYRNPATPFVASFFGDAARLKGVAAAAGAVRLGDGSLVHLPLARSQLSIGDDVAVMVRPDAAILGPPDGPGPKVIIERRRFSGERARIVVRLSTGERLSLDIPADGDRASVGDAAGLQLLPGRISVFPAGAVE